MSSVCSTPNEHYNQQYCMPSELRLTTQIMTAVITVVGATNICLQCFDAVGWAAGRASGL